MVAFLASESHLIPKTSLPSLVLYLSGQRFGGVLNWESTIPGNWTYFFESIRIHLIPVGAFCDFSQDPVWLS
jgi:hypothetical protein